MANSFKSGDKVVCIDPINGLELNHTYVVDEYFKDHYEPYNGCADAVSLVSEAWAGIVYSSRFKLVDESLTQDKYKVGDYVQHKNGLFFYRIEMLPSQGLVIEKTNEPAYMYKSLQDGKSYIRSQVEMEEEERFWKVEGVRFNGE